jgi:hypothetical protein
MRGRPIGASLSYAGWAVAVIVSVLGLVYLGIQLGGG